MSKSPRSYYDISTEMMWHIFCLVTKLFYCVLLHKFIPAVVLEVFGKWNYEWAKVVAVNSGTVVQISPFSRFSTSCAFLPT